MVKPREDLAATLHRLVRALVAAELPVLVEHDLSMWGYAVLGALRDAPASSQLALARAINADKTRLIGTLDDLQARGLINRVPDPEDRRSRLLSLTPAGERLHTAVQTRIQAHEDRLLAALPAADRNAFLRGVRRLAAVALDEDRDAAGR